MARSLSFLRPPTQANETSQVTEKPVLDQPQDSHGSTGDGLRIDTGRSGSPSRDTETAVKSPTTYGSLEPHHASQGDAKESSNIEPATIYSHPSGTDHIAFTPSMAFNPTNAMARTTPIKRRNSAFSFTGVGATPVTTSFHRPFFPDMNDSKPTRPSAGLGLMRDPATPWHIGNLLRKEVVGRNSQFHGLTHEEREQLGGVEYRAIRMLSWIVPLYFVLWQLLGCLAVGAWMNNYASDITGANGINAW
jgi:hypothetical protein